jgi:endonuclease/exonuclease/phosphatase family metal-dependent hydrolase
MADSNLVVGAWYANKKPVVFQDDQRHAYIVGKIKESKADIVALQEVWAKARMRRLQQELDSDYKYWALGADGEFIFNYLPELLISGIPERAAGSGLVLLSKYPIANPRFELYQRPHDDEEKSASKGVLTAVVIIQGYPLRIGMTHMWTDAGHDCSNVSDLVRLTDTGHFPSALMLGDFNIHRIGNEAKYNKLNQIMEGAGAQDAWTLKHGTGNPETSATDDQAHNNLAQFFSPMRNTERADCIDYVYLSTQDNRVTVEDARVLHDWKVSTASSTPKWYWVHEGTVSGAPTAEPFGPGLDKLCVVTRETTGRLRSFICDRKTNKWTSTIIKNGKDDLIAHGAPGMAWFADTLHVFFRGPHNNRVLKIESRDGVNWSAPNDQGGKIESSGGCCAIVFLDELYVFVRDPGRNGNQIRYRKWTPSGWANFVWIGLETDHNISAAVIGDRMCVVARAPGSPPSGIMHVLIDRHGRADQRRQIAPGASTSGSPGVAAIKGNFEVFYREPDGGGLHHRTSGNGWTQVRTTHQATNDEVCAVSWGDQTLVFFSHPVYNTRKVVPGKISYPDDAVLYPERAFAHSVWEPDMMLDASDHYPYQVDLLISLP